MRLGRVTAVADEAKHLTALHAITDVNVDGTGLEVRVEGVPPSPEIEDDVIAADRLERDRHGTRGRSGDVLRNPVLYGHDVRVGDGERVVAVREIARVLEPIAGVRGSLFVHLDVIDGEALCDEQPAVHGNHRATMATLI